MPNTHLQLRLSREEDLFLRHWMYDEVHYQDGVGPAKRLQRQHDAVPAKLAILIAAAVSDPADQEATGLGPPPPEPPTWPWSKDELQVRLTEAQAVLAERRRGACGTAC